MTMSILESGKKLAETFTGIARPAKGELGKLIQVRKPSCFRFKDDGVVPNHPRWPLIIYRSVVGLPARFDPAAVFEVLFEQNDWGRSWRNGIYDYVHYHSQIHEVLGVARGSAMVQFGGRRGRKLSIKAGDVAILPAGTGHERIGASDDFLVVGAYPSSGRYDECTRSEDHPAAIENIPRVAKPAHDPVYGDAGPLISAWKTV